MYTKHHGGRRSHNVALRAGDNLVPYFDERSRGEATCNSVEGESPPWVAHDGVPSHVVALGQGTRAPETDRVFLLIVVAENDPEGRQGLYDRDSQAERHRDGSTHE